LVEWLDGRKQILTNLKTNQVHTIKYSDSRNDIKSIANKNAKKIFKKEKIDSTFNHKENDFYDYTREVLLPHKMSSFGPSLATADLNGDNFPDHFIGGSKGKPAKLLTNFRSRLYKEQEVQNFHFHFYKIYLNKILILALLHLSLK
jgi:hypothetical protein